MRGASAAYGLLDSLDLAAGFALGGDRGVADQIDAVGRSARPIPPADALRAAMVRAWAGPAFVQFSGGVDSTLILSLAVDIARERAEALPVPITLRFADPEADERTHQQLVIDRLGIKDWWILDVDDQLDLLGPISCVELRAGGLRSAARIPGMAWVFDQLPSGSTVFDGEGGDEVLGSAPRASLYAVAWSARNRQHAREAARWLAADLATMARRTITQDTQRRPAWLTDHARELMRHRGATPTPGLTTMRTFLRWYRSSRSVVEPRRELAELADARGITVRSPLLSLRFLAELVASVPDHHFVSRPLMVKRYFGEWVPPEIANRRDKANFRSSVFGEHTREFARRWNGIGLPEDLVDPEMVRRAWLEGSDARSGLMLQHAWMVDQGLV